MDKIKIAVEMIYSDSRLPEKTYNNPNGHHDLGWDLFAHEQISIRPHDVGIVRTGLRMEIPPEYGMIIKDRSSKSMHYHIVGGVYDASFRGEICVNVVNYGDEAIIIRKNEKFAQAVIIPNLYVTMHQVENIPVNSTPRGNRCLGSTDV